QQPPVRASRSFHGVARGDAGFSWLGPNPGYYRGHPTAAGAARSDGINSKPGKSQAPIGNQRLACRPADQPTGGADQNDPEHRARTAQTVDDVEGRAESRRSD